MLQKRDHREQFGWHKKIIKIATAIAAALAFIALLLKNITEIKTTILQALGFQKDELRAFINVSRGYGTTRIGSQLRLTFASVTLLLSTQVPEP